MNFGNIEGQLTRWLEELSQYNMSIQHRPGNKHINADALSRTPDREEQCCHYKATIPLENLPCVGCRYCTRARSQWQTFEDDSDYVVSLAVRSINKDIEIAGLPNGYSKEELKEMQRQDKDLSTVISWFLNPCT